MGQSGRDEFTGFLSKKNKKFRNLNRREREQSLELIVQKLKANLLQRIKNNS